MIEEFDSRMWTGRSGRKAGLRVWFYNTKARIQVWVIMHQLDSLFAAYGDDGVYQ